MGRALAARADCRCASAFMHEWWSWLRKCVSARQIQWHSSALAGFGGLFENWREGVSVRMGRRVGKLDADALACFLSFSCRAATLLLCSLHSMLQW